MKYILSIEMDAQKDDVFILKFKIHDSDKEQTLEDTVAAAHAQIEEKI